jgi:hypothetical protein
MPFTRGLYHGFSGKGAVLRNQSLERADDTVSVFRCRIQQLHHLFTLNRSFTESYRSNNLVIHLHLFGGADRNRNLRIFMDHGETEIQGNMRSVTDDGRSSKKQIALQECEKYLAVFVDICEFVQDEKRVLLRVGPGSVRLQSLDFLHNRRVLDSLEPLLLNFRAERLFGCANGERVSFAGMATGGIHKLPDKIVERRSEVLKAIPDDQRNMGWHGMSRLKLHDGAINIPVCIQDSMTEALLSVPSDLGFKEFEMMFCPRQFAAY